MLSPRVVQVMGEAALSFVDMDELQHEAGRVVAKATGAEAGFVTAGCGAALVVATTACVLSSVDQRRWERRPWQASS